jgi:16S rRNA C1402 (ribose-2'-O) methylase RsmI
MLSSNGAAWRLAETLGVLAAQDGDRPVTVCRELTGVSANELYTRLTSLRERT